MLYSTSLKKQNKSVCTLGCTSLHPQIGSAQCNDPMFATGCSGCLIHKKYKGSME